MSQDRLYARPLPHLVDFKFDDKVARVFPDMIRRSVPGYDDIIAMTGMISCKHAKPDSRIYDLGCSLGASAASILARLNQPSVDMICIDSSTDMLKRCRANLEELYPERNNRYLQCEVEDVAITNASVVVMNFILQFIKPDLRNAVLEGVLKGLLPGGLLILSEKTLAGKNESAEIQEQLHQEFKRANGYSDLEIAQKRSALEQVMILDTPEAHVERLSHLGYVEVQQWYQAMNFRSFIAYAPIE